MEPADLVFSLAVAFEPEVQLSEDDYFFSDENNIEDSVGGTYIQYLRDSVFLPRSISTAS